MKKLSVVLVGNPNCGKTTLFNSLTGRQQAVGNWCGVTVEKKQGSFQYEGFLVEVVDLPGCYSCTPTSENAPDEQITHHYLTSVESDLIINVVDATNLERHLYLTLQLLEKNRSVIVVVNMMDAAKKQGIEIDIAAFQKHLGCPVVPMVALCNEGIEALKKEIVDHQTIFTSVKPSSHLSATVVEGTKIEIAKARYDLIHQILSTAIHRTKGFEKLTPTQKIDKIVLNRFFGIPIFLGAMYLVFMFAIHLSGVFQDFFDIASKTIFIDGMERWLSQIGAPNWLIGFMAFGVGQGINTTVSFIPVIAGMFFSLAFLEASGYMPRAAFVMDRLMQWVGLPGKSFVPMIIGFGCNVPAVMATRTLENYRERVLTVLMGPFMSCGARLAIYALFVSAFFPYGGQNIIFGLYLIGIFVALLTGLMLRTTVLQGERSALIIELPPYRWPNLKAMARITLQRLKNFILKAGALIIPLCVAFGTLSSIQYKGEANHWLANFGRTLTPVFAPMGIKEDNWPATVGLMTGVLAKEVVVGTLNALYAEEDRSLVTSPIFVKEGLKNALQSIPANFKQLANAFKSPLNASIPAATVNEGALGEMVKRFGSTAAAFAYLLFVLLYFPCVSVVVTMARELNRNWALFSVLWTTGIAYITAVVFYQSAIFSINPFCSSMWILGMLGLLTIGLYGVRKLTERKRSKNSKAFPTRITILDN